ncbi:fasciclin domain-containing protein [Robiginitalea sp. M366]|uniref:fasciclin domain-containing protein n=1 Tax=Robiginitalea aestuariiviva TaxID=3036903 RepID=UPI00240E11FD|nr:fasciclin domain-containing protein [Robiginitalea aestuariiviva]MDG1572913.1 fasciclin domain-containing protein [Robiginitalea aestuariiviva]
MKKITIGALALTTLLALSCGQSQKNSEPTASLAQNQEMAQEAWNSDPTLVGVASNNEQFSTLVAAIGAADLAGTLNSPGPFTVFAPTNEAFEKLPPATLENLLQPENRSKLIQILTYHVVPGKYTASQVMEAIKANNNAFPVETVEGSVITLSLEEGAVVLTDAKGSTSTVTTADVEASNGIIHVIDTVVLP